MTSEVVCVPQGHEGRWMKWPFGKSFLEVSLNGYLALSKFKVVINMMDYFAGKIQFAFVVKYLNNL
jgi:hypothetical protein